MPQITVRGISPEVEKEIRRISKKKNISINQVESCIPMQQLLNERRSLAYNKVNNRFITYSTTCLKCILYV